VIDDALVLRTERLRDSVEDLRSDIRSRYKAKHRQVTAQVVKDAAAQIGERWLVEIASRDDVRSVLGQETLANLNIDFQRLITHSEQSTLRSRYETTIAGILREFRTLVVVPLKQSRHAAIGLVQPTNTKIVVPHALTVFIGQSFTNEDAELNSSVGKLLEAYGLRVVTGERPKADSVSKKVRERIESAEYFLGIFTRRDRLRGRREWTTSAWVIDEKAYALANRKKLILLRETGVQSIGGIQGDYEYIEFARDDVPDLLIKLVAILRSLHP
jgi:hypothetical protein